MKTNIPVQNKFMLSVKEASQYFGIGTKAMRRIAEDHKGHFSVIHGNRYMIIRPKMEEFILECMEQGKGVDIFEENES